MKLWKIFQETDPEYIDLMENNIITYNPKYLSFYEENDEFTGQAYKWLKCQYKVANPNNYLFPWHLYYKVEGSTDPLNNKLFGISSPGNYIAIIFNIPDNQVLLYDDDLFIICLNRGYLSLTEQEDNEFEQYSRFLPKLGINLYKVFDENYFIKLNQSQQNLAKTYLQKVYQSWKRIFNIHLPANCWISCVDKTILGLTWELKKNDITDIINFTVTEHQYINYWNSCNYV